MAIKDPLMLITVDEFKSWPGFNKELFDDVISPDSEIWYAITIASSNIDYISGFTISKKWPENQPTEFTNEIQLATAYYVRFLLGKGTDYMQGQASIAQGGVTYSQTNPNDPYFIVPEVFNATRKIKEYPNFKGYNFDLKPKRNDLFSKFYKNCGENPVLSRYLQILNTLAGYGIKIKKINSSNIIGTQLEFSVDESIIPNLDNYYDKSTIDGKFNFVDTEIKGIEKEIQDNVKSLIDQINLKQNISDMVNYYNKTDIDNKLTNKTDKTYVDTELLKKQNKLTAGNNITIENDVISAVSTVSWIVGEYKWMPITVTKMPNGWKKVTIDNGLTLVQSLTDDITNGQIITHTHNLGDYERFVWYNGQSIKQVKMNVPESGTNAIPMANETTEDTIFSSNDNSGEPFESHGKYNLAAGKGAVLWQYDPNNQFS